jgi:hypothetical protein
MPALSESEIRSMLKIPCEIFVETGTLLGQTTETASRMFDTVHTIEIKKEYYELAKRKFSNVSNVTCHLGDSSILLGDVCQTLDRPTCFWLDGHWSAGDTGKGVKNVPLYEELALIMKFCSEKCVILIDDCRLFEKTGEYLEGWDAINRDTVLNILNSRLDSYSFHPSFLDPNDRMAIVLKER